MLLFVRCCPKVSYLDDPSLVVYEQKKFCYGSMNNCSKYFITRPLSNLNDDQLLSVNKVLQDQTFVVINQLSFQDSDKAILGQQILNFLENVKCLKQLVEISYEEYLDNMFELNYYFKPFQSSFSKEIELLGIKGNILINDVDFLKFNDSVIEESELRVNENQLIFNSKALTFTISVGNQEEIDSILLNSNIL